MKAPVWDVTETLRKNYNKSGNQKVLRSALLSTFTFKIEICNSKSCWETEKVWSPCGLIFFTSKKNFNQLFGKLFQGPGRFVVVFSVIFFFSIYFCSTRLIVLRHEKNVSALSDYQNRSSFLFVSPLISSSDILIHVQKEEKTCCLCSPMKRYCMAERKLYVCVPTVWYRAATQSEDKWEANIV